MAGAQRASEAEPSREASHSEPQLPVVLELRAHGPFSRATAALLVAVSRASLPALLLAVWLPLGVALVPPVLVACVLVLSLVPALAASALGWSASATVEVTSDRLVLRRRGERVELPLASIRRVEPWRLPLPSPGIALRLESGRRLGPGIACADPHALLQALGAAGVPEAARVAETHPVLAWAHARPVPSPRRRAMHAAAKFGLFGLIPTLLIFNLRQRIVFGGPFGQLHREGLGPYLAGFGIDWATAILYLVLYASVWRAFAEAGALAAAAGGPERSRTGRKAAEAVCAVAYYAGVPALLAARLLA